MNDYDQQVRDTAAIILEAMTGPEAEAACGRNALVAYLGLVQAAAYTRTWFTDRMSARELEEAEKTARAVVLWMDSAAGGNRDRDHGGSVAY
jgi:hypothetical protein